MTGSVKRNRQAYPLQFVPAHKGCIPTANGSDLSLEPTLIATQSWTDPTTIDDDAFSASHAGAGAAGTTSMTLGGALTSGGVGTNDYARNIVIIVTHGSAVVAMSGTITGTDQYGRVITEAWSVTATGTSKTFTGAVAFKTVTAITEVVVADASANSIKAGQGKKLGLNFRAAAVNFVGEMEGGAIPTAGVIVKGSSSANADYRGTYTPNSTLNGALDFEIFYLVYNITVQP